MYKNCEFVLNPYTYPQVYFMEDGKGKTEDGNQIVSIKNMFGTVYIDSLNISLFL
jgi:hypothetical protein